MLAHTLLLLLGVGAAGHGFGHGAGGGGCLITPPPTPPTVPQEKVISAAVISTVEKDWRNLAGYLVELTLSDVEAGTTRVARFERTSEEFKHLDASARSRGLFGPKVPPFPSVLEVGTLDAYLRSFVALPSLNPSQLLDDFAAINYKDCFELQWFKDALSLPSIFITRQPSFWPSPPNVTRETVRADETPFECWLYIMSWQSHKNTTVFQPVLDAYTARMPEFELGFPLDNSDVWAPGVQTEPRYPTYYTKTPVHFLPGGFKNSRNIRLSYLGRNKFSFLEAANLDAWIQKLSPIYGRPKRILDVGTGQCFSAFAFNRAYPEAEVVGIDLSAGQIRSCRMWVEKDGTKNVSFYHANAENLPFASGSFDIVQYSYVLHEMPARNAFLVISEMWRVLKPGGVLSGFEVPYFEFGVERNFLTDVFTWGKDWNSSTTQGPEPYFGEFENFNLIKQLKNAGMNEPVTHCSTVFDTVVTVVKSPEVVSGRCPQPAPAADFKTANVGGIWYEIGKAQTSVGAFFEGNCSCTRLSVEPASDGTARISNACRKNGPQGKAQVVNTTLSPTARGPGAFKEQFSFGPITNTVDYTFIAIDLDGEEYAVEYDCQDTLILSYCFHILARQPTVAAATVDKLMSLLTSQLNPSDVAYEPTAQSGCWHGGGQRPLAEADIVI